MNGLKRINYSNRFDKQLKKAPSGIQKSFRKRLLLFLEDRLHPQLCNHSLKGKYEGYKSINVTGDWRALYIEKLVSHGQSSQKVIIFEFLGTHSQLYKS